MSGKYSVKKYIGSDAIVNRAVIMDKISEIQTNYHRDRVGGTIYLPSGKIPISNELLISSYGVTIKGEGPGSTLLYSIGGSNKIIHFGQNAGLGGIEALSLGANAPKTAIYQDDGDFTGLINGGGCFSTFQDLTFLDGIHTGVRVGVRSNLSLYSNLKSFTNNLYFMVHVDADAADHENDNATANIYTDFGGKINVAGILFTGGSHGDAVISNLNLVGVNKGSYGVVFIGGDYYNSHVVINNIHFDGIGISAVAASQAMRDVICTNITIGGAITGKPVNITGTGIKWIDEDSHHI